MDATTDNKHWSDDAGAEMWFRLDWYTMENPKKEYHGKWTQNRQLIKAWVKSSNATYPKIIHYMRCADNPQRDYKDAEFVRA